MDNERHTLRTAVYLILKKGNQILLQLRKNTGYQDGNYSLPSGHLEGGEPATAAMVREAKEEVGVDVRQENLKFVHVMCRKSGPYEYIDIFFATENWRGAPKNLETDKHGEVKWASTNDLPKNMVPEIRYAIENYTKGNYFSEFYWQ